MKLVPNMIDLVAVRLELNDDEVKSNPFRFNVGVYVVPEPRTVLDGLIALDNVVVLLLKNLKEFNALPLPLTVPEVPTIDTVKLVYVPKENEDDILELNKNNPELINDNFKIKYFDYIDDIIDEIIN